MIHSPSFLGYTSLGAETTAAKTDLREVMQAAHPKQPETEPDGLIPCSNSTLARQE